MAGSLGIVSGIILGQSAVTLLARILGLNGQPITVASIASISWSVQDLTLQEQVDTGTWLPASVLFDSLQQNDQARWDQDDVNNPGRDGLYGYNFLAALSGSEFAAQDVDPITSLPLPHRYQVDVQFTPAIGSAFRQSWQLTELPTWP